MMRYAVKTEVISDKNRAEIERALRRFGATQSMHGYTQTQGGIAFELRGRRIKFVLQMPDRAAQEFTHTERADCGNQPRKSKRPMNGPFASVRAHWRRSSRPSSKWSSREFPCSMKSSLPRSSFRMDLRPGISSFRKSSGCMNPATCRR